MAAVRPRVLLRHERAGLVEPGLEAGRELGGLERRARDVLQDDGAIGADDRELPIRERNVGFRRLQQARGDLLALGDDLVRRGPQRGAADDGRARAHGAHAEADALGVAVDVAHVGRVEPEALVQDLLERRLVPLALVLRSHQERGAAARREADLGELRLRAGRLLDRVHDGQPAEHAPFPCRLAAGRKTGDVGELQRLFHVLVERAAVVVAPERRAIRHRARRDDVPAAQLDAVHAELARGVVDEALDDVRRLRPPGAPVRRGGVGVGHHAEDLDVGGRKRVDADERRHVAERRQEIAIGRHVGADVGERAHAEPDEPAVGVERQLGVGDVVARVLVGGNRLAPLAHPLDRAAELARGPQHQAVLGILPALGPERAADVAGDDADPMLGDLQDVGRERGADAVRVLDVGVERVAILAAIVDAERAPRLHVLGVDARDDVAAADDPRRLRERGVGRRLVARLEEIRDVVRALVPHRGAARLGRRGGRRHGRQRLVVDAHEIGGVLRLSARLGDHHRDRVTDVACAVWRQPSLRRGEHGRAVRALPLQRHRHRAEAVAGHVRPGEDGEHAGRAQRRRGVDPADARVRVHRADDHRVGLARQIDVGVEAAFAANEADVLEALDALPDPELAHAALVRAPARTWEPVAHPRSA